MKRILFLLLLTVSVYGQNPSRFAKIQITGNTNSGTATKVNVQEANGEVNTQTINTGFNKNIGLGGSDVVGATTLLNQYSTTPVDWTASAFNSGQVVFFVGKQWISKTATVAGDVPAASSKWEEITFDALANKTVTVDQTIIDGSTNAVSSNAVFDGLALKANLASPALTGTPTAPTATAGTNTTRIATTAFVAGGLATKENAFSKNTAFNKNFGTTAGTVAEGNDSRINNGQTAFGWGNHAGLYPSLTGAGANGTWGININGNSQTSSALGEYNWNPTVKDNADFMFGRNAAREIAIISQLGVRNFLGLGSNAYTSTAYLPLSGGTLTGIVTAPTAPAGTNTTQIATTAFVQAAALPYKLYTFYVNQSGANIPTSVKLSNNTTLSSTTTWERSGVGDYRFFIGTVDTTKVFPYAVQSSWSFGNDIYAASIQGQYIQITRRTNGVLTDGLSNILFEIRQYP